MNGIRMNLCRNVTGSVIVVAIDGSAIHSNNS
jgi:hypothetical protein